MNLTSVDSYMQQLIRGAIIALAVIYDIRSKNRRTKSALGRIEDKKEESVNKKSDDTKAK